MQLIVTTSLNSAHQRCTNSACLCTRATEFYTVALNTFSTITTVFSPPYTQIVYHDTCTQH